MRTISEETGVQPGEKTNTIDLDYCDCLGWCSNAPNIEVDDSRILFDADPNSVMDRIANKASGVPNTGQVIDVDDILNDDILGDLHDN